MAKIIVDAAYKIHTELGPGLLESVYETVLAFELELALTTFLVVRAAPDPLGQDQRGEGLFVDQAIVSEDGRFRFVMQGDGNLVLYGPGNKRHAPALGDQHFGALTWTAQRSKTGHRPKSE